MNMLIRFNVKNFLSFYETDEGKSIEFSMLSGKSAKKSHHLYDDGKIKLLKLATVYGANASGKSNLVRAIDFMKHLVTKGFPQGCTEKYCRTRGQNKDKPSYFEVEIKIENKYYAYGFECIINKRKFTSEWLMELQSSGSYKTIFERDIEKSNIEIANFLREGNVRERLDVYAEDVREDDEILFLSYLNERTKKAFYQEEKVEVFRKVFLWFVDYLDINYPDSPISDYSYLSASKDVEQISKILSSFGTGITDFKMVDTPIEEVLKGLSRDFAKRLQSDIEKKMVELGLDNDSENARKKSHQIKNDMVGKELRKKATFIIRGQREFYVFEMDEQGIVCKTIKFQHENKNFLFDLAEESDGTIRVLDLLEILLSDRPRTYVIDELDRCLHPALSYRFIELFLELVSKKNIQLIVTTHESRLLDFDLLRRDEIWFVDKNSAGESKIYSLEEYNERFDRKIDKAYLDGRYGGVPIFTTLFPIETGEFL